MLYKIQRKSTIKTNKKSKGTLVSTNFDSQSIFEESKHYLTDSINTAPPIENFEELSLFFKSKDEEQNEFRYCRVASLNEFFFLSQ